MVRVQISMDEELLKRVDAFVKKAGLSRSGFLSMAASDYIDAKEKAPEIGSIFAGMAASFEQLMKGEIDKDEFQTQIDGFDQRTRMLKK